MAHRIRRFGIVQTAKTIGVLYFFLGLVFLPVFLLVNKYSPNSSHFPMLLMVLLPVLYAVCGAVVVAIGCAIYNGIAGMAGGVEIELEDAGGSS